MKTIWQKHRDTILKGISQECDIILQDLCFDCEGMGETECYLFKHICRMVNDIVALQEAIDECTFGDTEATVFDENGEVSEIKTYFDCYMFFKKFKV